MVDYDYDYDYADEDERALVAIQELISALRQELTPYMPDLFNEALADVSPRLKELLFEAFLVLVLRCIFCNPSPFALVCKLLKYTKMAAERIIPLILLVLLASVSAAVFSLTFLGFLVWSSVVLGHDPEVPQGSHTLITNTFFNLDAIPTRPFPIELPHSILAKHLLKLFHDTHVRIQALSPIVVFGLVVTPTVLLVLAIYERLRVQSTLKREISKRIAVERAITEVQLKIKRHKKQLEDIEDALECPICYDRLSEPFTLAPCGHTFDLPCLQVFFRTAHPTPADLRLDLDPKRALFALKRQKFCPCCNREVRLRPAPALALGALGIPVPGSTNVWRGTFVEYVVDRLGAGV